MMRFNVWCDVVLTKFGNYFVITDTQVLDELR